MLECVDFQSCAGNFKRPVNGVQFSEGLIPQDNRGLRLGARSAECPPACSELRILASFNCSIRMLSCSNALLPGAQDGNPFQKQRYAMGMDAFSTGGQLRRVAVHNGSEHTMNIHEFGCTLIK